MSKNNKNAAARRAAKQEAQAKKVVNGVFIGIIVAAVAVLLIGVLYFA